MLNLLFKIFGNLKLCLEVMQCLSCVEFQVKIIKIFSVTESTQRRVTKLKQQDSLPAESPMQTFYPLPPECLCTSCASVLALLFTCTPVSTKPGWTSSKMLHAWLCPRRPAGISCSARAPASPAQLGAVSPRSGSTGPQPCHDNGRNSVCLKSPPPQC